MLSLSHSSVNLWELNLGRSVDFEFIALSSLSTWSRFLTGSLLSLNTEFRNDTLSLWCKWSCVSSFFYSQRYRTCRMRFIKLISIWVIVAIICKTICCKRKICIMRLVWRCFILDFIVTNSLFCSCPLRSSRASHSLRLLLLDILHSNLSLIEVNPIIVNVKCSPWVELRRRISSLRSPITSYRIDWHLR